MRWLWCALAGVLFAACSDATEAGYPPGMTVMTAKLADTVTAPPVLLTAVLRDDAGRPIPDVRVTFYTPAMSLWLLRNGSQYVTSVVFDTTDAAGLAGVMVQWSSQAGMGWVIASADPAQSGTPQFADSIQYKTLPGLPARLVITPFDTAVYQGNAVTYAVQVADQFLNPRPETGQLSSATSGIAIEGSAARATAGPSRQVVRAAFGTVTDSAWLSIVPRATIAARSHRTWQPDYNYVFASLELDGSNYQLLLTRGAFGDYVTDNGPQWTPTGDAIVFFDNPGGSIGERLYSVTTAGTASQLFAKFSDGDFWPQMTLAGDWIYFAGEVGARVDLFRSRLDGTEASRISPQPSVDSWLDLYPSPSPDGTRVVYATSLEGGGPEYHLRILDVGAGTFTSLGIAGTMPRWSPTGEWIAFLRGHQLFVVRPNGADERPLSPTGTYYDYPASWSPDGQYLVATRYGPFIDVFIVASGVRLPLAFTAFLSVPTWRP